MQTLRRRVRAAAPSVPLSASLAFALALVLCSPTTSFAREWIVPIDAPTVAAGIDSAQAGDVVTLTAGTYYEYDLVMKDHVTLRGGTGNPEEVVIDAYELGRVMDASNLSGTVTISDLTFANGSTTEFGAGVYMNLSYATFDNCLFTGNDCWQEGGEGGGVYVFEGQPTFVDCRFHSNSVANPGSGGGIHIETSDPLLVGCDFYNNIAGTRGGAVSMVYSSAVLENCRMRSGGAGEGAGIAASSSSPTIVGCTLYSNWASFNGSGLALYGTSDADIDNTIIAFGLNGGSVYTDGFGSASLDCSDVYGNLGGDYISLLSGLNGINGNISEDPLFCDSELFLSACSPCASADGCEQIGALGVGCTGRTWVVPTDYATVSEALNAAAPCDTVFVSAGTYFEQNLVMKSGVVLRGATSQFGAPTAVLDGQNWMRIMTGTDLDSTTVIENLRFAYGDTTGVSASGGALSLTDSDVLVRNCAFANNTADVGGAVEVDGGSPTFRDCSFDSNEGYDSAGAVVVEQGAIVLFDQCNFWGNQASGGSAVGGAVSCYTSSQATFSDCWFAYNSTPGGAAAVYAHTSAVDMSYCTITNNTAGTNGGVMSTIDVTLNVDHCTFARNEAPNASGFLLGNATSATIYNSIIAFGVTGEAIDCYGGATADLNCTDVYDNDGGDYVGCLLGQNGVDGNISEDPRFCEVIEGESYELHSCSPCAQPACGSMGSLGVGCTARTWIVPIDAPTIAAALDSAAACDTVLVQQATYYEHDIVMKNGVYLLGEEGATIDAQGLGRVFYCASLDSTTVIDNFMIANGETLDFNYGGAMYVTNSQLRVRNCDFMTNSAYEGGAVYLQYLVDTRFTNCTFQSNQADIRGGAVRLSDAWPVFEDCTFRGNQTTNSGSFGGAMWSGIGSKTWLTGCEFLENETDQGGGAVYADACTLIVSSTTFSDNRAHTEGAFGGGVALSYAKASFDQCTFSENHSYDAAHLYVSGDSFTPTTIDRSIFAFGTGGAAVECVGTPSLTLTCSDVYGNAGGDYVDCLTGLDAVYDNFSEDPMFCGSPYDLGLSVNSPCVSAPGCGQVGALGVECGYTVYVPGDYATIQEGINAASSGDTVVVACGTYDEGDVFLKSGVYLTSETGEFDCVTIAPEAAIKIFYSSGDSEQTVVRGFTLEQTQLVSDPGVGMFLSQSDVTVENCHFKNLESTTGGGGVHMENGSSPSFTDCLFTGCGSMGDGGAVSGLSSSPTFTGCGFQTNYAAYDGGGARFGDGVNALFESCTFDANQASVGGSAIACVSDMRAAAVCTLRNSIISNGWGGPSVAATYCAGSGAVTLECCDVWGNEGGDYVDCLSGQNGVNGNFSEDPRLCGGLNLEQPMALSSTSPCLAENQQVCGQIGAYGMGCAGLVYWDDGGDGTTWEDPYNWDTDEVPGADDHAWIGLTDTVTVSSSQTVHSLTIDTAPTTLFEIQSGTFTVMNTFDNWETVVVRDAAVLDAPAAGRGSQIVNESGATFQLDDGDVTGSGSFLNRGYFQKTGLGRSHVYVDFWNDVYAGRGDDGLVDALEGTLDVGGELDNDGRLHIVTGQGTMISKHYVGREDRAGSGTFVNDGSVDIDAGGQLIANANTTITSTGTVDARGDVSVGTGANFYNESGATFNLEDGDLLGTGGFTNRGYFTKTGTGWSTILLSFTNESGERGDDGVVDAAAGTLDVGGELDNDGRLHIVTGQGTMISKHYLGGEARAGSGTVVNTGTIDIDLGGMFRANALTTVSSSGLFESRGDVEVRPGAQFSNAGNVHVKPGGRFDANGSVANQIGGNFVNRGRTSLGSGAVFDNDGYFDLRENALLRGSGTFDTTDGVASMKGIISPGASAGTMTYLGDFYQTGTSHIIFEIGGYTAGTEYDVLSINGAKVLDGAVELFFLPGFEPVLDDSFDVIVQTGGRRGDETDFDCFAGLTVSDTLYMEPVQRASKFVFRAVGGSLGNGRPIAVDDLASATGYASITIDVLANDTDPDFDALSVLEVFADDTTGEVYVSEGDQSVGYAALPGFAGADSFRYVVGDCVSGIDTAYVYVDVTAPPRTWYVPEDALTIQAGIDSAAAGDTVVVACGIYYESEITLKSGVTLLSETGEPDCVIIDSSGRAGRPLYFESVDATCTVSGFTLTGGYSEDYGGGAYFTESSPVVQNCVFDSNLAQSGGGVACVNGSYPSFVDCVFTANQAAIGAGVVCYNGATPSFDGCLIADNVSSSGGGAAACIVDAHPTFTNCTLVGNEAPQGAGIYAGDGSVPTASHTIIALSTYGEAVYCYSGGDAELACSDVWGNYGGDWIGCIGEQGGVDGNFSADPTFCLPDSGNYYLQVGSPCGDAEGCGLVGAYPEGCEQLPQEPDIDVAPLVVEIEVGNRAAVSETLTITNEGQTALLWRIREATVAARGSEAARPFANAVLAPQPGRYPPAAAADARSAGRLAKTGDAVLAKGERDRRSGARGSGGPDGFGYTWTDSDEPGGPTFVWNDISTVGTPVTLLDDDFVEVTLPFVFPFYGRPQTTVSISSNGYLTFGPDATAYNHDPVPLASQPNNLIAPYWVDLNPELGGTIHYHHDEITGRFVVQYTDIYDYWSTGTSTFQVTLDPDGSTRFKYFDMNAELSLYSIGVEDILGASGLQVAFNAPYVHDALTVLIQDAAPWLVESPPGGIEPAGTGREIELTAYTDDLPIGLHEVDLVFESNDPDEPEFVVSLRLLVVGPPQVAVEPDDIALTVTGGEGACDTLRVANEGGSDLTWVLWNDPREPELGPRDAGGPDAYGYTWKDDLEQDGPVYSWFDIAEVGSQLLMGNDTEMVLALPFAFPFYGEAEYFVTVSSNGYLSFGDTGTVPANASIPDEAPPNAIVAPFWDDLDPGLAGTVHAYWNVPGDEFIIQYTGVPRAGEPASGLTFQAVLRDDGSILFQYNTMVGTLDSATIGLESSSGAVGLQVAFNEPYVRSAMAVEFTPGCPWLVATPWHGVTAPGGSEAVSVCVDPADLGLGEHVCNLLVRSDDPDSVTVIIPVLVQVVDTGIEDTPTRYELLGNFPNPFNPVTEIRYALPDHATVDLEIYTLNGRLVRRLLVGLPQDAGRYAVVWDGREDGGSTAASGVYFYRLVADGDALTRKMILLK